jgi:DNA-binding NtrC family response regulator
MELTSRVLVVDDEPSIRHLLQHALAGRDYEVLVASSAFEALAQLERVPADLAIIDLMLPEVNGLNLAEAIRMLDPGTPVVLITAYGSTAFESMAAHPAISHYLHKPFALDRLLEMIERLLGGRTGRT